MYPIVETNDYETLSTFFYKNGLEVKPGIPKPASMVKLWACNDPDDGNLIAAAALQIRDDVFVIADIAVDEAYRSTGLGIRLMGLMDEEIKNRGGKEAWLAAKVPGFYEKLGWKAIPREDSPDVSDCLNCPQFGNDCEPKIMRKII